MRTTVTLSGTAYVYGHTRPCLRPRLQRLCWYLCPDTYLTVYVYENAYKTAIVNLNVIEGGCCTPAQRVS